MSLASVDAKGGKPKNHIKRDTKNFEAKDRYTAPTTDTTYSQCGEQALEIAKRALTEAKGNKKIKLHHAPESIESLTVENCQMTYTNYDWFKLTYLNGDEICEVHVVVAWLNWLVQGKPENYALKAEHTQQANDELSKCVSTSTLSGKVNTDIEEELKNELEDELIQEENKLEHEISQVGHEISQVGHEISQEEKLEREISQLGHEISQEEKLEREISQVGHEISQEEKSLQKVINEAEQQAIDEEIAQKEANITPLSGSVDTKSHNPHFDNPFEALRTHDFSSQDSIDSSDSVRTLSSIPSDLFIANLGPQEESNNSIVKVWNKDIAGVPMKKAHQPLPHHEPVKIWSPEDLKVVPYHGEQNFAENKYHNLQLNLPEDVKAHYFQMHSAPTELYNHAPHKISSLLVDNVNKDVASPLHDSDLQVALYNPINIDDIAAKAKAQMEGQAQENKHETAVPVHHETKHETPAPVHEETKHETKHDTPAPVHQETKHDIPAHQETQKIEVINAPTFGPGRRRLPNHNQRGKTQLFAGNDIEEDNDIEESAEDNSASDKDAQPAMLGGWSACSEDTKDVGLGVFSMLIRENKIGSITVYSQNLVKCKKQIVNGTNYTIIASFNRVECFLSFYRSRKGDITLYETDHNVDGLNRCTVDYKP